MLKKIVKKVVRHKGPLDAYRFHIDAVTNEKIAGWAHKNGEGNYSPVIEIRNDGNTLYMSKANVPRADLKDLGIGSGEYGFFIDPTKIMLDKDIDSIDIFIDGHKANPKPFSLTLLAKKTSTAKSPISAQNTVSSNKAVVPTKADENMHQMYIDKVSVEKVIGWAKQKDSVTHRSFVELKVGNVVIGSDTADTFRQSIKNAGIGDGSYCFEINPLVHLFPATKISCDLYIDGKKSALPPIALSVTEQELEAAKFADEFSDELSTFGDSVTQELQRLTNEIEANNDNAINVALENIASLSVRVEVIEQILTKHFAKK